MDLHPIFVHFPIALLTIYSLIELVRWKWNSNTIQYIKATFVILGVLGAFAALISGNIAVENYGENEITEMHELFGYINTAIYTLVGIAYSFWLLRGKIRTGLLETISEKYMKIIFSPLIYLLAVAGLITITIAGALGGILVHGTGVDPITDLVYNILF